ncbi:uncharacterized protein G2W53_039844 [Senna tora]|uniref:Uncharacterized protein n=1 Tax=Senna tora TaxID=362788 RepID=A0A834SNH2_9FABA|nr:uncharacterized protein G2W53_039844 [Senna tora]
MRVRLSRVVRWEEESAEVSAATEMAARRAMPRSETMLQKQQQQRLRLERPRRLYRD